MAKTQAEKAAAFEALHTAPGVFVIPNPWDPGSARLLAGLGFKALTTTSAGYARSIGFPTTMRGARTSWPTSARWRR
jgi:2-methylisocitrate lyase-like PEP mutase family enzyme